VDKGRAFRWSLILAVLGLAVLFTIQNSSRLTDLSLDLGMAAWHLERPLSVPALLWGAFALGVVGGLLLSWLRGRPAPSAGGYGGSRPRSSSDDGWS
jgi:hypothetical protein